MPMVEFSAVLNSDAQRAWSVVKKFGEIQQWHPAIVKSSLEDGESDGAVGCLLAQWR
ncbi:hypothetical protein HFV06_14100 [Pseudomonas fluorescens]|nr:SRPBCC family protein [Pseudomonas fluorescens]NKI49815.1 hypothetical protein [Pseudomonas fluorescens]NKI55474.1 hypothetical protein [Pseudomonas fluorescens]NKI64964.1 hypothetical protein [Pseudomonas fluorescens]